MGFGNKRQYHHSVNKDFLKSNVVKSFKEAKASDTKVEHKKTRHAGKKIESRVKATKGKSTTKKAMGKGKKVLISLNVILFALIALLGFGVYKNLDEISNDNLVARAEPYELKAGVGVSYVVKDLCPFYPKVILSLWVKLYASEFNNIQKGFYVIDGSKSLVDVLHDMQNGNVYIEKPYTLAIADGMQYELLKKRVKKSDELVDDLVSIKNVDAFIKETLKDKEILDAIKGPNASYETLEGLLLPATYPYYKETKATDLIASSLVNMAKFMQEVWPLRDKDLYVKTPYEALILASLVEKESALDGEKAQIASVFYNRLNKNIRLQTDPAVMYGVSPLFRGPLRLSQLKKDTPYNTYTRTGLPPTPIAMPSQSSIMATLHPVSSKALFFVAKSHNPKDGHVFSATLKEHNKAVASYRKAVREYNKQQKEKARLEAQHKTKSLK